MVKRPRIASKPGALPPNTDNWVKGGGVDPEIQQPSTEKIEQEPNVELPEQRPVSKTKGEKGKPYPHRVSFDMSTTQYKRLKRAAFDTEQAMNEILREAVEGWLKERGY